MASDSKIIAKAGNKCKKYVGARRSCAWVHSRPNSGSSTKYSMARPPRLGGQTKQFVESKEAHRCHTENNEELRSKCIRLENELEFANQNLAHLHSTVQLSASQTDCANSNVRELVRCFDTWARDLLDFPMIRDLRSLRGMVHDIVDSVDFSGPRSIGNINVMVAMWQRIALQLTIFSEFALLLLVNA